MFYNMITRLLQRQEGMTTFGWSDDVTYIYLSIKFLTPALGGQFLPVKSSLCRGLFQ